MFAFSCQVRVQAGVLNSFNTVLSLPHSRSQYPVLEKCFHHAFYTVIQEFDLRNNSVVFNAWVNVDTHWDIWLHQPPYIHSSTMDPPGSDLSVSQLLFALKWKLDRLQTMEGLNIK
jgi:hypothetical protein